MIKLNEHIDHTLLKPNASLADFKKLCHEARQHSFKTVCVLPSYVPFCKKELSGSNVLVCSVVSFPLGSDLPESKASATAELIAAGADEVDFVVNYGMARQNDFKFVARELALIRKAAGETVLKAILETSELSDEAVVRLSQLCVDNKIDFVKTSTGTTQQGATVRIVALIKKTVGQNALVKAAGGIRSREDALNMIEAGASRLGTSQGVALVSGQPTDSKDY